MISITLNIVMTSAVGSPGIIVYKVRVAQAAAVVDNFVVLKSYILWSTTRQTHFGLVNTVD